MTQGQRLKLMLKQITRTQQCTHVPCIIFIVLNMLSLHRLIPKTKSEQKSEGILCSEAEKVSLGIQCKSKHETT